jgi:hypothetical protein
VLSTALAGCFLLTMTMAQSCSTSATYGAGTFSIGGTPPAPTNTAYNGSGSSGTPSYSSGASTQTNSTHIDTTGYTADQSGSEALSDYLKHHRLPLVGAQVLKNTEGQRAVVLYGFVGSDFGKQDATAKAHTYLADANIPIDNRITVRPELLTAGHNKGTGGGSQEAENGSSGSGNYADENAPDSQYPGVSSYEQQANQAPQASQAQQYAQQQSTGSAISSAMPLLMLGLMALSVTSGGAFAVGPGSLGSSPFGSFGGSSYGAPYNPYPGFASPSPYGGSSVTPFGGAGSPYTATPPSYSPYGP